MKKILAFAAASVLASAQPYTAYCAELMEVKPLDDPYTISVSSLYADTSVTNGKFTITYDTDKLTLISAGQGNVSGILTAVNTDIPGKIICAFASDEPVITDFQEFLTASFSCDSIYLNDTDLVSLKVNELVTENEKGEDVILPSDALSVVFRQYDSYASLSDAETDPEGNAQTYIQLDHVPAFTNGAFTVTYDPAEAKFAGGEACGILKNALYDINETEPGKIKIAFISSTPVRENGPAVRLSFTGVKNDSLEADITVDEFYRIDESGTENRICVFPAGDYMSDVFPGINPGDPSESVSPEKCDINEDGSVTTADIITLIKMITEGSAENGSADINGDGNVDSADAVELIKILKK